MRLTIVSRSMGTATPLIIAGVLCVVVGGAMGFVSAFEGGRYQPSRHLTQQTPSTAE